MRAWAGLLEAYELLRHLVETQLRQAGGVTQVQYEILHRINQSAPGQLCMTELAERMVASRSGSNYQVTQMEKMGLIEREPDPDDARRTLIHLTEQGRQVLHQSAPGHVRTVREGLLDALDPQQVAQLADIMDAARRHLRDRVQLSPPRKQQANPGR